MNRLFFAVEHNPDGVILLKRAAKSSCCELQAFHDDPSAMRALAHPHLADPDVLLVNIKLPYITGTNPIRAIKSDQKTMPVPVIAFSSSSFHQDIADAYAAVRQATSSNQITMPKLHLRSKPLASTGESSMHAQDESLR